MTEEERIEQERLAEEERLKNEDIKQKAIDDLKAKLDKAVDPQEYAKLKADYKKLMDDYINKRPVPIPEKPVHRPSKEIVEELRGIKDGNISNRDYIVKALEYRKSHIAEFGKDPFTNGAEEATKETEKVAGTLERLLQENPTPTSFRIALNETLKDDDNIVKMLKAKAKKNRK